ncbi:hypothetical protein DMN91_001930 [Ooceraea biroi]|uniref:Uncharacterized protein n=1 Tax=Ooceraea biroi TaxID=2015173 RepID=A0A3L8DZ82_OOCBI|nr:hypothetical protein DMN91_001930 [Ooceraea biroi]
MHTCNLPGRRDWQTWSQSTHRRQGHVHAPYTSLGSGVAVGLKGRSTHRELRWGRPTGSACVGVSDSTPPVAHPSQGMKKIERQGRPAAARRAVRRRVVKQVGQGVRTSRIANEAKGRNGQIDEARAT